MKRRRHASATLDDQKSAHVNITYHTDENINVLRRCQSRLRQLLQVRVSRRRIAVSVLLLSSLGVLVVILHLSTSKSPFTTIASRSYRHRLSDRDRILQQLAFKHDGQLLLQFSQVGGLEYYIEYRASKGLGHRLTRAAAAYHSEFRLYRLNSVFPALEFNLLLTNLSSILCAPVANRLGVGLRQYWGECPAWNSNSTLGVDVWDHLFESQTTGLESRVWSGREKSQSENAGQYLTISNEVPGYKPYATRKLRESSLARSLFESNMEFYRALRHRFVANHFDILRSFVTSDEEGRKYIDRSKYIVIGLHVRAGNGEFGEFVEKKRVIENSKSWIEQMVPIVVRYIEGELHTAIRGEGGKKQPLIFVATDTPSILQSIRLQFAENEIEVTYNPHNLDNTTGPSYLVKDRKCLKAWELQMIDMVLLSLSDVIVAGRYSSFVQTMPLSLLFSDRRNNKMVGNYPYCELEADATSMSCFRTLQGWMARQRRQNPQRIVYNKMGILEGDYHKLSTIDGHEDALAYPTAPTECLERPFEYYFGNPKCLEAHLNCDSDTANCK